MLIQRDPPLHLSYCLNVHPGESLDALLDAVRGPAAEVARQVAGPAPFGLGLRVGAEAAAALRDRDAALALRDELSARRLYAFTINGFPYGRFHGGAVKEQVYEPDWRTPERLRYTRDLAHLLVRLLPEGVAGSISTVPVGFAARLQDPAAQEAAIANLLACARFLARLEAETGCEIHLGLEPEPACLLETTGDAVAFMGQLLLAAGPNEEALVRRHVGVCFDTCHVALAFEPLADAWSRYAAEGIRVSKVQLSAALEADAGPAACDALGAFEEPVYLHQVRARMPDGSVRAWDDLPAARAAWPRDAEAVRVHFHVPLHAEPGTPLRSTANQLDEGFLRLLADGRCAHAEVETYTFDVLPPALRGDRVEESIVRELAWLRARPGMSLR